MLLVELPEFPDLTSCELFEHQFIVRPVLQESIQLRDRAIPIPVLDPVEEEACRFVPGVPLVAAPFDPVWRRKPRTKADPIYTRIALDIDPCILR